MLRLAIRLPVFKQPSAAKQTEREDVSAAAHCAAHQVQIYAHPIALVLS